MSGFAGFIEGFAGTLAKNVQENKQEARNYFNKQVEYARTTGLANRQKVKAQVDANLNIARQLEQVGVPREVIMAQINQNPTGLADFYQTAEELRAKNQRDLTPEEWRAIFKIAGDFKAPDEDLASFVRRTYDPISSATSDPAFQDDPEGGLLARMLGFTAMDEARSRLGKTVIAEGLTADQLIRYGDVTPQRVGGNAIVTVDYSKVPGETQERGLSTADFRYIEEQIDKSLTNFESNPNNTSKDVTAERNQLINELQELYPRTSREYITGIVDRYIRNKGFTITLEEGEETVAPVENPESIETTVLPAVDAETPPPSGETSAPSSSPASPTGKPLSAPLPVINQALRQFGVEFVRDLGDGTSEFRDSAGNLRRYPNEAINEIVRRFVTEQNKQGTEEIVVVP